MEDKQREIDKARLLLEEVRLKREAREHRYASMFVKGETKNTKLLTDAPRESVIGLETFTYQKENMLETYAPMPMLSELDKYKLQKHFDKCGYWTAAEVQDYIKKFIAMLSPSESTQYVDERITGRGTTRTQTWKEMIESGYMLSSRPPWTVKASSDKKTKKSKFGKTQRHLPDIPVRETQVVNGNRMTKKKRK